MKSSTLWSQAVDKLEEEDRKSISGSRDNINLVEGFIGEIEKKQEECDKKRWFYTNSRGKNVFLLDGLVTQLNKYANIGDIALQHHPDVVSLAWSGFRFLLQVGTAYTEDMQTASESLEYLLRVLFCCDIYEKLYCETGLLTVQPLNTSLVELYVSILEYLCYIKRFLNKDTGERVLASFVSELKGLLKNVQQKESTVLSYVDKVEKEASAIEQTERREETERLKEQLEDIKKPLEEIETAVKMVYEAIESKKLNILRWLSDIKFIDHHTFSRERRQEKTGQWLEENETYKEWKNSKSSSLLWLRGDAGYGKTILISYVIDELQTQAKSNENMLAYFYCNYKEDNRRRPETVLRTLVKQFCLKSPGDPNFVPLPVSSIYVQRERDGHASGELRCQESTDLIINLSRMYHQVTIIVDALDECYNETRRELFLSLRSIVKSGSNVKVFLASRFEQDIALMFEGYKCHYIQASDNTQDINNYIDLQLNLHCDARRYGAEKLLLEGKVNEALKEEIRHTLKIKANGMFMWVNLQILALCEEPTPSLVRKALDQLPKDLNETYDRIIEKIEAKEGSNNTAKLVLKWLLYAREPCTVKTITQALAVGAGENPFDEDALELTPSYIIDCCKNLVVEDSGLGKLRFAHFSVQEYLLRNPKFNNDLGNHTHMAEICLKALLNHHRKVETPCKVENLLDYAAQHWGRMTNGFLRP
ncbi:hypothetical protein P167DRAFT_574015 [Morchella conica CCBAS932]|uniref:Uncharacterized protein n=1 Tax=Morchella conica CCBAS932 TaxID=1392247 RepID=A0A3N4KPW6_9PEZI|nr:hypothetical protein P167DRAFT_574015 [Morchella conica CCBAS932]